MKYMKFKNGKRKLIEKIYNIKQNVTHIYFQQYETIRSFGESIYTHKTSIVEAEKDQNYLLENIVLFNKKSRPGTIAGKDKKRYLWKNICSLWRSRINS